MSKKNLILDIDDTLLKTVDINYDIEAKDNIKIIKLPNFIGLVYLRPHLFSFLKFCYRYFNVSFWTAGSSLYCREILKLILTQEQYDKTCIILARDNKNYVDIKTNIIYKNIIKDNENSKPLNFLWKDDILSKTFNKRNTIIIDNNIDISYENIGNSILIEEFNFSNEKDIGLCFVSNILNLLRTFDDVREFNNIKNISKSCNIITNL